MNFSASVLRKKSNISYVKQEVDNIYRAVKGRMLDAHNAGQCKVEFDLPDTFYLENLERKDMQLVVYSDLIERLESEDYTVEIDIKPSNCRLYVSWPSELDEEERARRNRVLVRHLKRTEQPKKDTKR